MIKKIIFFGKFTILHSKMGGEVNKPIVVRKKTYKTLLKALAQSAMHILLLKTPRKQAFG